MNRASLCKRTAAVAVACLLWTPGFAQSEKVTIRMTPQPNQTVRMRTVQENEVEVSFEPAGPLTAAAGPMKLITKTVFGITQKSGAATAQGNIEAEVVYDEINAEASMNGQVMPSNDVGGTFLGKKLSVTFDKQGKVLDVKVPPDIGVPQEAFKQVLESMYGNLPSLSLSVGETTTVPLDFTLPLPIPGAASLKMDGVVKHTLVSVQQEAAGRIAKVDHTIEGKMLSDVEVPLPTGKVKMNLDFTINGGGSMLMDLEKGFARSSESKATFEGKIKAVDASNSAQVPPMNLKGTTKTTISTTN